MQRILALAAIVPSVMGYYYECYREKPGGHALTGYTFADFGGGVPASPGMTVEYCESECTARSFDLWALEYTGECYCGDSADPLPAGSFPMFDSDCNMPCAGNSSQICGGSGYFSLYGSLPTPPALTPNSLPDASTYVDEGCNSEGVDVRALSPGFHFSSTAMTIEACGNFCYNSGYLWFGLEYMNECYCGAGLDVTSVNTTLAVPSSGCTMACSGNAAEICGGSNRLSTYQWIPDSEEEEEEE